jgi:hypothetical protein
VSKLRIAGLVLIAGAAVTLGLHFAGVPEDLYRRLYHHLISGLDVPEDPSEGSVDAIRYVSLFGGLAELAVGAALLIVDSLRRRHQTAVAAAAHQKSRRLRHRSQTERPGNR